MTRLAFGASGPWAMPWFAEGKAGDVLRAALEGGIIDIDTGPSYAHGNAEPRLGRLLEGVPGHEDLRLSSKVGTQAVPGGGLVKDYGAEAIDRQLAHSLAVLRRSHLDVLYLHGPDEHQTTSALRHLKRLQHSGQVEAIGVCTAGGDVIDRAVKEGADWVMAPYNVLDQANGPALRRARAAGVRVAVVAPLAQALWRRDLLVPRSVVGLWYAGRALIRNRERIGTARRARWLRSVEGWSPAALMLAFVRETLAPDLILTTTTNPAHMAESCQVIGREVPADLRDRFQGLIVS